jgi:transcriptional regulator with XRE-family HTH domain
LLLEQFKERFGGNVRQRRKQLGLSQEELAAHSGLSETSIGLLERGKVWPQFENLQAIADQLQVPIDALFASEMTMVTPSPLEALEIVKQALSSQKLGPAEREILGILSSINDPEMRTQFIKTVREIALGSFGASEIDQNLVKPSKNKSKRS